MIDIELHFKNIIRTYIKYNKKNLKLYLFIERVHFRLLIFTYNILNILWWLYNSIFFLSNYCFCVNLFVMVCMKIPLKFWWFCCFISQYISKNNTLWFSHIIKYVYKIELNIIWMNWFCLYFFRTTSNFIICLYWHFKKGYLYLTKNPVKLVSACINCF